MVKNIGFWMLLIVITACQNNEGPNQNRTHLLHDYSPLDEEGHVQAVVEIPAGTLQKWEVEKETGELEWEIKDGQRRVVDYLSYPGNYGMIPQTYLPSDKGGDGDPLDVLILGEATKRGEILPCEIIGVLKLLDRGEIDDKLIAVPVEGPFSAVESMKELNEDYPGAQVIIETWFTSYKGPDKMESLGFEERESAIQIFNQAISDYKTN